MRPGSLGFYPDGKQYSARICKYGQLEYLGYFPTKEAAVKAHRDAKQAYLIEKQEKKIERVQRELKRLIKELEGIKEKTCSF